MIHLNVIEKLTTPIISKMPAAEFCGRGNLHEDSRFIYEIELSNNLTLVMDELQALELCEALLDALPAQHELPPEGEAWKEAA